LSMSFPIAGKPASAAETTSGGKDAGKRVRL
jgi:hypothetical protein